MWKRLWQTSVKSSTDHKTFTPKMRAGKMADFEVDGKVYKIALSPMKTSRTMRMQEVREKTFRSFSEGLRKRKDLLLLLSSPSQVWKLISSYARLRLCLWLSLSWAEVDRSMFDRQIDLIMKDFAPVAQKFINTWPRSTALKKLIGLDLDSALNLMLALMMLWLGHESVAPRWRYSREIARYQTERWVDFAVTKASSGGYAADASILVMWWVGQGAWAMFIPWSTRSDTLVNSSSQTTTKATSNAHMSTYYVEILPLTVLLLSDYLEQQFDDPLKNAFALTHRLTDAPLPQLHHPLAGSGLPTQRSTPDRRWYLRR